MRRRTPIRGAILAASILALWSTPAEAHLVTTGLGPVYDGLTHLALTPEDLLPALALALLAGLRGAPHGRTAMFLLPAAWLAGGLAGLGPRSELGAAWTTASFLILGALVAADAPLPRTATAAVATGLGLLHGFINGQAMPSRGAGALALTGISAALFALVTLVSAFVVSLRASWARVAVRVLGSWIAATGLLLLGWALRPKG